MLKCTTTQKLMPILSSAHILHGRILITFLAVLCLHVHTYRALSAGVEHLRVIMPTELKAIYEECDLVTLLGALQALYTVSC